jgi:hypothetical protein
VCLLINLLSVDRQGAVSSPVTVLHAMMLNSVRHGEGGPDDIVTRLRAVHPGRADKSSCVYAAAFKCIADTSIARAVAGISPFAVTLPTID